VAVGAVVGVSTAVVLPVGIAGIVSMTSVGIIVVTGAVATGRI
jgi:hypothetical protein